MALAHPLQLPLVAHDERRAVQLSSEIVVEVVSQADSTRSSVRVEDHMAGLEMQNEAAKQEGGGALATRSERE